MQTWLCAGVGTAGRASLFGTERRDRSPDRTQKRLTVDIIVGRARSHISNKLNSWKGGKASRRGRTPSPLFACLSCHACESSLTSWGHLSFPGPRIYVQLLHTHVRKNPRAFLHTGLLRRPRSPGSPPSTSCSAQSLT